MKNLIPGTYNQGKIGKKLNLYTRRFDTFEYEFEYKYYNSEGVLVTGKLTNDVLAQASIKQSNKYNSKVLKYIPVYHDRINNKIKLVLSNKENDLPEGKYYYDVEIFFNNKHFTYLSGWFIILPQVTDWKDYYKLDYQVNLSNSLDCNVINPVNLYNALITNKITFQKTEVISQKNSLGTNISYEFIKPTVINTINNLNSTISYNFIPIILAYEVNLISNVDYLKDIMQKSDASLISKIEYEIF